MNLKGELLEIGSMENGRGFKLMRFEDASIIEVTGLTERECQQLPMLYTTVEITINSVDA